MPKHDTKFLYDLEPTEFAYMPYHEALKKKRNAAKALWQKLQDEINSFYNHGQMTREQMEKLTYRQHFVYKAMVHNEHLLDEIEKDL